MIASYNYKTSCSNPAVIEIFVHSEFAVSTHLIKKYKGELPKTISHKLPKMSVSILSEAEIKKKEPVS